MKDKETRIEFKVIDNNTGKEADIGKIALKEDWAKGLMYCDMQGFAILDDGNLVLLDECGKFEYCPSERFSIKFEDSVVISREKYREFLEMKRDMINNIQYKRGSKETAEKILFKFESVFAYYDNKDMFSKKAIFECIEEIVKSIGVEIKEYEK